MKQHAHQNSFIPFLLLIHVIFFFFLWIVRDERTRRTPVKHNKRTNSVSKIFTTDMSESMTLGFEESDLQSSDTQENVISNHQTSGNVPVDFQEFSRLVARCMQRRDGLPGRSSVYPSARVSEGGSGRKIHDRIDEECTFHPIIDQVCYKDSDSFSVFFYF